MIDDRQDLTARVLGALETTEHAVRAVLRADEDAAASASPAPGRALSIGARPGRPAVRPLVRPLVRDKVLGEAALLLRGCCHLAAADARVRAASGRLLRLLEPHVRGDDLLTEMCVRPAQVWDLAYAHVLLRDLGSVSDEVDAVIAACIDAPQGAEQAPHRQVERSWLHAIWSGTFEVDDDLLTTSCLGRPLDAFADTTQEGYEFTHLVLHATNVGMRSPRLPRDPAAIVADAETALAAALDADNFDLAAELLWTWPMLGIAWSAVATFGLRVLTEVVDDYGFLPGPEYRAVDHRALPVGERADYLLRTSYHANLVLGLLSAAMLLPGRPAPVQPLVGDPDAVVDAHAALPRHPDLPRWEQVFTGLGTCRRAPLAPFVLAVGLRRACRAHDLAATRQLLQVALRHGLSHCPAAQQAAGLLRRSTQLALAGQGRRPRAAALLAAQT